MKYKVERTVGVFVLRVATNFGRARGSNVCITSRTSHIRIANTDMNHPYIWQQKTFFRAQRKWSFLPSMSNFRNPASRKN